MMMLMVMVMIINYTRAIIAPIYITHKLSPLFSLGHTGIADSQGVIHDFAGPYSIGVGEDINQSHVL